MFASNTDYKTQRGSLADYDFQASDVEHIEWCGLLTDLTNTTTSRRSDTFQVDVAKSVFDVLGSRSLGFHYAYQDAVRLTRIVRNLLYNNGPSSLSCTLVLSWWQTVLNLASKRGFETLREKDPVAHCAFCRWIAGTDVWSACVNCIRALQNSTTIVHPELEYMLRFDHSFCLPLVFERAESLLRRIEDAECHALRADGDEGFVRFCSRSADLICDMDRTDAAQTLADLQEIVWRNDQKSSFGTESSNLSNRNDEDRRTRPNFSIWSFLFKLFTGCMCGRHTRNDEDDDADENACEAARRSVSASTHLKQPKRSAWMVREYIRRIAFLDMPRRVSTEMRPVRF